MARKIEWHIPEETDVEMIEVNKSTTLYGSYSVVGTTNATSDTLAKSSSNTWVTTYTDSAGNRTDWYKIRFYDGTNYSEYSEPVTSEELVRLCTVDDVKKSVETTGRWTDDDIFDNITKVDDLIYVEFGTPIEAIYSPVGKIDNTVQTRYYVGEEDVYRVDRMFWGTTSMHEVFLDDGFKVNERYGMVEILPVASSGVTLTSDYDIEVHYVPRIFNELAIARTVVRLLENSDTTGGGTASKEVQVARERLAMIENVMANKYALQASSRVQGYDKHYGVNRKRIMQNHDRNRYIGSTGW